ncbi:unnamed protein product [Allacma fusca]|uniref:PDZ domain-containing protein n=1 Tax=Allacma fusca TaxID=39272 RepID=A0A8J2PHF3_9HEXA|nr:unnamed protein product [Allacma fusca]
MNTCTLPSTELQGPDSWVVVHKLKSQSDGGILDPDDKLVDVADDREQIMAIYEEDTDGMPSLQHNAGDGTSASSVGTNSPDIFQGNDHKFQPFARTDIEITGEELSSGPASGSPSGGSLALQVRRGSEPALNRLSPVHLSPPDPSKRWSAAPVIDEDVDDFGRKNDLSSPSSATAQNNSTNSHKNGQETTVGDDQVSTSSSSVIRTNFNANNSNKSSGHTISVIKTNLNQNSNSMAVHSSYATTDATSAANSLFQQKSQQPQNSVGNHHQHVNHETDNSSIPRSASAGSALLLPNGVSSNSNSTTATELHLSNSKSNSHLVSNNSQFSSSAPSRFSRDQNRLSMQITNDGGARWADAADRALWLSLRKEPLGATASPETPTDSMPPPTSFSTPILYSTTNESDSFTVHHRDRDGYGPTGTEDSDVIFEADENAHEDANKRGGVGGEMLLNERVGDEMNLVLLYESGPLGIHVVPEHLANAKNQGLIVQGVEPGGRIDRDGRVQAGDKIIEINGHSLLGVPFQKAQDLFREGLSTPQLRLKVIKYRNKNLSPLYENNSSAGDSQDSVGVSVHNLVQKFNNGNEPISEEKENMIQSHEKIVGGDMKVATVSPTKKLPLQAVPLTRPSTTTNTLITSNTRKIGRKYEIDLKKGVQGLGFSITTRDNPAGGNCPIYIKNILPTGAAIDDGRLRPGDRLLEVNGIEITGKSQSEAVSILRNVPQGGIVKLIVSRQERVDLSPKLPRQIPPEKTTDGVPWSEREMIALDIPVLDTEKAGLGISVKGKTTAAQRGNMVDMGIYIKSVIHGGAASRDGRLKNNDQLLSINGVSLLDRSNTDAMETLRKTMTQDGPKPKPGFITLTIARRVPSSSAPTTDISGCGSSASGDEMDSWGSRNNSISVDTRLLDHNRNSNSSHQQHHNRNNSFRSANHHHIEGVPEQRQQHQPGREYSLSPPQAVDKMTSDLPRNPVLDRLTGKVNTAAMRNESYYRATNETWNATLIQSMMTGRNSRETGNVTIRGQSITVQNVKGEMVLVEDDYSAPQKPPRRSRSSTPDDALDSSRKPSAPEKVPNPTSPNGELPTPSSDTTYASQTSLEDSGGFSRDAFGRQSMSEKRHATLDAKNTDTYQRNKKLREERERQRQLQAQQGVFNDKRNAEALARERNLQDELARRGIKRPFSSSTEDDLALRSLAGTSLAGSQHGDYGNYGATNNGISGGGVVGLDRYYQPVSPEDTSSRQHPGLLALSHSPGCQLQRQQPPQPTRTRKGLGDQLIELFHQWGNRQQSAFLLRCYACGASSSLSTHRPEGNVGLARVNSADSLVDPKQPPATFSLADHGEGNFKGSKRDIGPSLGMKKSSSLESLQTMVQEIQIQEDVKAGFGPARAGPAPVRVVRGRGCNESFRQAVDRSYDAPLGELGNQMETLAEEETESCISGTTYGHSQRPPYSEPSESEIDGIYGKSKGLKKKPGLLRGLGSMFRFGRHRKSTGSGSGLSAAVLRKQQAEIEKQEREEQQMEEIEKARAAAQSEQMRIQEQYRRLVEKQRIEQQQQGNSPYGITVSIASTNAGSNYSSNYSEAGRPGHGSLGPHHQFRKSMENQAIRERERERERDVNGNHFQNPNHLRSASYDVYNEMTRPGSRVGFADPKKYSHYINYEEIRHHLNRRHQQHYHSQRRENTRSRQERPVSNFYEYESVQAAMHAQHGPPSSNSQQNHQNHHSSGGQPTSQKQAQQQQQQQQQQQALYVMNGYSNNNGVTLPSPSTIPMNYHQRSPSQFQAQTMPGHSRHPYGPGHMGQNSSATLQHQQSQQKFQQQQQAKPNSLPRRSQKEIIVSQQSQQQSSANQTNHRHHPAQQQQQQQQYQQMTGRYKIAPSQGSVNQNPIIIPQGFRSLGPSHTSNSRIPPSTTGSSHNHNHSNGVLHRNHPSVTLGSKV